MGIWNHCEDCKYFRADKPLDPKIPWYDSSYKCYCEKKGIYVRKAEYCDDLKR